MRAVGFVVLLFVGVLTTWQCLWLGPSLPDSVASHFDVVGKPDGFMAKTAFLATHAALQFGNSVLMLGIAYCLRWIPPQFLNMPNKDYWLHEDRREETLAFNASLMIFIAGLTALFFAGIFQLVYQANVGPAVGLSAGWMGMGLAVYLGAVIATVAYSFWHFRIPDGDKIH